MTVANSWDMIPKFLLGTEEFVGSGTVQYVYSLSSQIPGENLQSVPESFACCVDLVIVGTGEGKS